MAQAILTLIPNYVQIVVDDTAQTTTLQWWNGTAWTNLQETTNDTGLQTVNGAVTVTGLVTASGGFTSVPLGAQTPPASPLVSGTVYQNTSGRYMNIYQPAYATTSGTAGTVVVALGSSSTPSTIYTDQIGGGTSNTAPRMVYLKVPPSWYYSVTTSATTLLTAAMIAE